MLYNTPVTTIEDLKTRIRRACRGIRPDVLGEAWDNVKFRLKVLRNVYGGHIESLVAQANLDVFIFPSICTCVMKCKAQEIGSTDFSSDFLLHPV